jgi:putative membrane protein
MGGMASLDMKFAMDAAYGNNAEIAAATMALDKSQNSDIRSFAQMMIDHHTQANADLARMSGGAPLPSGLDPHHRAVADGMAKLSGMDFDMAYVKGQIADHAMALDLHDMMGDDAKNRDLKAYAKKTEPVVKRHFEQIKAIDMRMAGAMTAMNPR